MAGFFMGYRWLGFEPASTLRVVSGSLSCFLPKPRAGLHASPFGGAERCSAGCRLTLPPPRKVRTGPSLDQAFDRWAPRKKNEKLIRKDCALWEESLAVMKGSESHSPGRSAERKQSGPEATSRGRLAGMLAATEPLESMATEDLRGLGEYVRMHQVPSGEVLFREGEYSDGVWFLIQGRVEILRGYGHPTRYPYEIATVTAGNIIGEVAILDREPHTATAYVRSDSVLIKLGLEEMKQLLDERPRLGVALLLKLGKQVALRLRRATD